ncbi:MAG: formate dehydrogenase family accessory protein FdhD [Chloroflexi bacterium RBG_13_51_18]|nr:MAG: formate dehydrogenase family accessory protein FdhD [Chloroflexi bacterium RBG_13_51_18]
MNLKTSLNKTSRQMDCWKLTDGRISPAKTGVVLEQGLALYVNDKHLATASISPIMEKEFVVGYLFGQGFINTIDELESLEIKDNKAKVTLKDKENTLADASKTNYRIVSGGGRSAYFETSRLLKIKSDLTISKDSIFKAMNNLFKSAGLYGETEGVHAAGLFSAKADPICLVEDIGRHNTLDKVIGYALLNKIDCSKTFLVSTGRMASEMVTKICRCGIPVVATKTAVTDKGLEIGKKCGLTVIGFVRDKGTKINTDMDVRVIKSAGMKVYSGAARISL